jgi:hypothetical protein
MDDDKLSSILARLEAAITKQGWAVMNVHPSAEQPGFTYSIGFEQSFDQPEVVFIGVPPDASTQFIRDIAGLLKAGKLQLPVHGGRVSGLMEGMDLLARPLPAKVAQNLAHVAFERAKPHGVELLQLCYPDPEGRLPGDEGFSKQYEDFQDYSVFER